MTATDRALDLARAAAAAAADKLATTIVGIDVSEHLALTDVFVIVSAESERQVGAIVDEIEDVLRDLKQVNAHLVAAAAYPVLKTQGELLPSRLREPG